VSRQWQSQIDDVGWCAPHGFEFLETTSLRSCSLLRRALLADHPQAGSAAENQFFQSSSFMQSAVQQRAHNALNVVSRQARDTAEAV
jgi:hypothetical protein